VCTVNEHSDLLCGTHWTAFPRNLLSQSLICCRVPVLLWRNQHQIRIVYFYAEKYFYYFDIARTHPTNQLRRLPYLMIKFIRASFLHSKIRHINHMQFKERKHLAIRMWKWLSNLSVCNLLMLYQTCIPFWLRTERRMNKHITSIYWHSCVFYMTLYSIFTKQTW